MIIIRKASARKVTQPQTTFRDEDEATLMKRAIGSRHWGWRREVGLGVMR